MATTTIKEKQAANRTLARLDGETRRRIRDLSNITATSRDNPLQTYLYTATGAGSWTKPDFGTKAEIWACAGGPGGGSGRKGAASSLRGGGSQGIASSPRLLGTFDLSELPESISFEIGAGGAGGASQTTNSTNGINGSSGGTTTCTIAGYVYSATSGTVGGGGGVAQRSSSVEAVFNVDQSTVFRLLNTSGPGGDALADNTLQAPTVIPAPPSNPTVGANATVDLAATSPFPVAPFISPSRGGAASITGNAGAGGDGALGTGGSGGGGATNDVGDSGAGGTGGNGFVYFVVY